MEDDQIFDILDEMPLPDSSVIRKCSVFQNYPIYRSTYKYFSLENLGANYYKAIYEDSSSLSIHIHHIYELNNPYKPYDEEYVGVRIIDIFDKKLHVWQRNPNITLLNISSFNYYRLLN
jgi:hypothetical protein